MGAVVNILYENKWFLPFFSEKMDQKRGPRTPENGDMQVFSIRILFSTLIDASLKWAQNQTFKSPLVIVGGC